MKKYYYDLHIHSCLSPCADNDMTPNNIAGMGSIKALNIMALTDHNTCGNCPAFCEACKKYGIIPIPGMELTTAEDIHLVCLFATLDAAMAFDNIIKGHVMKIKNRPDIFGQQLYMDENDNIIGEEETLLISATDFDIASAVDLVRESGGICYPAHVDRQSNGIISTLGDIPFEYNFHTTEFHDIANVAEFKSKYRVINESSLIFSSDAHHLWDINEADNYFTIDDQLSDQSLIIQNLLFNII